MSDIHVSPAPPRRSPTATGVFLVVLVLLCLPVLVEAGEPAGPTGDAHPSLAVTVGSPLFAGWMDKYITGLATRSNVVRICIGVMALALFIMLKKFDGREVD